MHHILNRAFFWLPVLLLWFIGPSVGVCGRLAVSFYTPSGSMIDGGTDQEVDDDAFIQVSPIEAFGDQEAVAVPLDTTGEVVFELQNGSYILETQAPGLLRNETMVHVGSETQSIRMVLDPGVGHSGKSDKLSGTVSGLHDRPSWIKLVPLFGRPAAWQSVTMNTSIDQDGNFSFSYGPGGLYSLLVFSQPADGGGIPSLVYFDIVRVNGSTAIEVHIDPEME